MDSRDVLSRAQAQLAAVAALAAEDLIRGPHEASPQTVMAAESQRLSEAVRNQAFRSMQPPAVAAAGRSSPSVGGSTLDALVGKRAPELAAAGHWSCDLISAGATVSRTCPGRTAPSASDASLANRLATMVAACRQARCPVSLLLAEIAGASALAARLGEAEYGELLAQFDDACQRIDYPAAVIVQQTAQRYAILLPDCERAEAIRLGNALIEGVRRGTAAWSSSGGSVAVSVGVGTVSLPPKNFPANDLLVGADRCLRGSHASGGCVVKSIEIY
jgi:GGDEF domain-containing protein